MVFSPLCYRLIQFKAGFSLACFKEILSEHIDTSVAIQAGAELCIEAIEISIIRIGHMAIHTSTQTGATGLQMCQAMAGG